MDLERTVRSRASQLAASAIHDLDYRRLLEMRYHKEFHTFHSHTYRNQKQTSPSIDRSEEKNVLCASPS
jgi:hypothetical protein